MPRKGRSREAPDELLTSWAAGLPRGRVLDLGAGDGAAAEWLAGLGFGVEAVERDPRSLRRLRRMAARGILRLYAGDLRDFPFPREAYVLVLAMAVLHFLPGADREALADRISAALRPGGLLIARVFVEGKNAGPPAWAGHAAEFRPLAPGELPGLFSTLRVEENEMYRWLAPGARRGYRSCESLVARRPESGGV